MRYATSLRGIKNKNKADQKTFSLSPNWSIATAALHQTGSKWLAQDDATSDPLSKNAVSAFQITCKLLSVSLEDSWIN